MKFSVLISVYRKEKAEYLAAAIKSVLDQTRQPDQIVIVKDGPLPKRLEKVIEKYAHGNKRFTIVSLTENKGLGIALNEGLAVCKHPIVARMDTDDIAMPDRFQKQIEYLAIHPDTIIVGSNIQEYDNSMANALAIRKVPEHTDAIISFAKKRNPFNHMSVVFKKDAILEAGGYQHCPYFEDYYLWLRVISRGGEFYNIQENLVHVRAGQEMISRRGGFKYAKHAISFQKKALRLGFIDKREFLQNCLIRVIGSIVPGSLRKILYNKKLRAK